MRSTSSAIAWRMSWIMDATRAACYAELRMIDPCGCEEIFCRVRTRVTSPWRHKRDTAISIPSMLWKMILRVADAMRSFVPSMRGKMSQTSYCRGCFQCWTALIMANPDPFHSIPGCMPRQNSQSSPLSAPFPFFHRSWSDPWSVMYIRGLKRR